MIKAAFNVLYNQGYICRAAVKGDPKQVVVDRAQERRAKGQPVAGAVFCTEADIQKRGPDGSYPLYFGRPHTEKFGKLGKTELEIGCDVVKAIKAAGGWCEWDGDPTHAVVVKEN
jgi:hypothetical protein